MHISTILIFSMHCKISIHNYTTYCLAAESSSLKVLLSFAVGGLLGDVFLHLLPEAWGSDNSKSDGKSSNFFI